MIRAGGADGEVGPDGADADLALDERAFMSALDEGQDHLASLRLGIGIGDFARIQRHAGGDDFQDGPDVRGVAGTGLEVGDERHDALDRAGQHVGRRRRRGGKCKDGQGNEGRAGTVFDDVNMGGDGLGEPLSLVLHGVYEVKGALGVRDGCGDLCRQIAQDGLITAYLVYPVSQPDALVASATWPEWN